MAARLRALYDGLGYLSNTELGELTLDQLGELEIEPDATVVFSTGPRRGEPLTIYNPQQAVGESAGGVRFVYNKGPGNDIWNLTFDELDRANKELLETFVTATAIGASEQFMYDDHNGRQWKVEFETGLVEMRATDKRRGFVTAEDVWVVNFQLRVDEEYT